ncbi:SDR family NAD(P)-dependent oxidoreductase [Hydrogenovibrio kuenenii]|uniref:SDR family NAD(P)-dependent oxidoreductase n=1 Tax=Hydrogenovibrio kuenenii TaxID=63658 RepID=UPI00046472B8|nr:SDR family oxidoreductase [Hydrogenovibrio kuenenii]
MQANDLKLVGLTALVTGTSSGIGQAIAKLFAWNGAKVYGADIGVEEGRAMETELKGSAGSFVFHEVNLLDGNSIEEWVEMVQSKESHVDILCNVAGISKVASIEETDEKLLLDTLGVNFLASYRLCKLVVPIMKEQKKGVVINVASELAFVAQPDFSAYCASKGAVVSFSRSLALEVALDGIRVNILCPGPVETPMLNAEFEHFSDPKASRSEAVSTIPLGRLGTPDEIAKVALFLSTDDASFIQGASIMADGGKTLM